jgi:amino acid adenylation domain-containing protein
MNSSIDLSTRNSIDHSSTNHSVHEPTPDLTGTTSVEPTLLASESECILFEKWNQTDDGIFIQRCIHELIEDTVSKSPQAIAILGNSKEWTYSELNCRANRLARFLRAEGIGEKSLVGVCMPRSPEMIAAVLGILKSGAAYVPIDPTYPEDRIRFMLEDTGAPIVFTSSEMMQSLPKNEKNRLIPLDSMTSIFDQLEETNLNLPSTIEQLAYVIYTSGSTGRPKGVMVRHRPVVNVLDWINRTFQINSKDRILWVTSLSFDLSVYDLFGTLSAGSSIRIAVECDLHEPNRLLEILETEPITIWDSAPPMLQQLVPFFSNRSRPSLDHPLRLVMLSGDWIPVPLPDRVRSHFPNPKFVSLGGATESSIWSNWYPIGEVDPNWTSIPYGKPIRKARYYLLNEQLQPVPIGATGEMFIGGEVLADGYLNREELTKERFIPDPFVHNPSARMYRTGDLGRYFQDGNIEFLGRIDHQVKIRGYRVELGEVESTLAQSPSVREAVVQVHRDASGHNNLIGFVVPKDRSAFSIEELTNQVKSRLPQYMVPSQFVVLQALPMTPNGKIDRAALKIPIRTLSLTPGEYVAPETDAERALQQVWQETLQINPLSVTANFTDLGGHSLLAALLMAKIETKLGHRLPLESLFRASTIREQARLIQEHLELGTGNLVPFRKEGTRPPLFLIAGVGGHVFTFYQFSRMLGEDQPCYGVKAIGVDGHEPPLESVEEIAARYMEEILQERPKGPFILGGYSMGALIAYELALRLEAKGYQVPRVISFDMFAPGYPKKLPLSRRLWLHTKDFWKLSSRDKLHYATERMKGIRNRLFRALNLYRLMAPEVKGLDVAPQENLKRVWAALNKARDSYWPKGKYRGQLVLIATEKPPEWAATIFDDPLYGWSPWAGQGVELHTVPASHLELFNDQNISRLAELIRDVLDRVPKE